MSEAPLRGRVVGSNGPVPTPQARASRRVRAVHAHPRADVVRAAFYVPRSTSRVQPGHHEATEAVSGCRREDVQRLLLRPRRPTAVQHYSAERQQRLVCAAQQDGRLGRHGRPEVQVPQQGVPRSSHVPAGPGCQQDGCGEDKGRLGQMASWLARVKTPRNVTCIG